MLEFVNTGDVASFVGLIVVLCWLGGAMIRRHAGLRAWGWRFAAGALLVYCVAMGVELDRHTPAIWLRIVCRGLLAAGLTLGVTWIVLAVYGFMKSASDRAGRAAKSRADDRSRDKERKQAERDEQKRRELWEREAPERERQWQMAEEQRLRQDAISREARQAREDTRYACELFYNLHAPTIADRFSKQDLHDFLNRYMGDAQSLDVIRRRAGQLTETISRHVEAADPPEDCGSLEALTIWYSEHKVQIERLNVDATFKEDYLVQLNERFAELSQRMMEALKP